MSGLSAEKRSCPIVWRDSKSFWDWLKKVAGTHSCTLFLTSFSVNFGDLPLNSRAGQSPPLSAGSTGAAFPLSSDGVPKPYDTNPYGRPGFLTGPAVVTTEREGGLSRVATAPGSLPLGPAFSSTGSTTIPTIHNSLSIQSMPAVPRRRGQFQLPCSPHSPQPQRTPDRYIDVKKCQCCDDSGKKNKQTKKNTHTHTHLR